jgi:hypothetical protein
LGRTIDTFIFGARHIYCGSLMVPWITWKSLPLVRTLIRWPDQAR